MQDGTGMSKLHSSNNCSKLTSSRIFWFLLILSIATFIPLALFLPETCRQVVGDASIPPPWICNNVSDSIRLNNRLLRGLPIDEERQAELRRNYHPSIPNPLTTLRIVADFESALLLATLSFGKSISADTVTGFR